MILYGLGNGFIDNFNIYKNNIQFTEFADFNIDSLKMLSEIINKN